MRFYKREAQFSSFLQFSTRILVSTDIASRGLDLPQVEHVILYDFPLNAINFLHRVGRTARAGQGGKATSLVTAKDRALADVIQRNFAEQKSMEDTPVLRASNSLSKNTKEKPLKSSSYKDNASFSSSESKSNLPSKSKPSIRDTRARKRLEIKRIRNDEK